MRAISVTLVLCLVACVPLGCGKKESVREARSKASAPAATATGGERPLASDFADGGRGDHDPRAPGPGPVPHTATTEKPSVGDKGIVSDLAPSAKSEGPMKSLPAVAEPVTGVARAPGRTPKQPELQSGLLTAGSFDDNLDPLVFRSFVKKMGQFPPLGDLPGKLGGERLLVLVKDAAGKPVGSARVRLSANGRASAEVTTRTDGRAVFILSWDQLPAGETLTATVSAPDGSRTATETIPAGTPRWEVTLPGVQAALPKNLDFAIVLDTTGSMSDELEYLKAEIRGIAAAVHKRFPEVQQRFALILYRDEGDEYVARAFDFTSSLDDFHKRLAAQSATGGGDYPEAVHRALEEANQLRWRDRDTARVLFLIGDAPPHAQFTGRTMNAVNALRKRGVSIYPVACSGYDDACEFMMRASALLTGSQFLFLTDDSGVGGAHAEPRIPYYHVERLERLIVRMIAGELSGRRIEPTPTDILRTVGRKIN